jgi:hypothetical protein
MRGPQILPYTKQIMQKAMSAIPSICKGSILCLVPTPMNIPPTPGMNTNVSFGTKTNVMNSNQQPTCVACNSGTNFFTQRNGKRISAGTTKKSMIIQSISPSCFCSHSTSTFSFCQKDYTVSFSNVYKCQLVSSMFH